MLTLSLLIFYVRLLLGTRAQGYVSVEKTYYEVTHINDYDNYGDVSMFEHYVPEMTVDVSWRFETGSSNDKCPIRNVTIMLQHGSYPLPQSRNNKTYPADFFLHRTSFHVIDLNTTGNVTKETIFSPTAGRWFGIAFVNYQENNEVIQKITDLDCHYYILINVTTVFLLNLPVIVHNMPQDVMFNNLGDFHIYRFYVEENIWHYDITVTNCVNDGREVPCDVDVWIEPGALPTENSTAVGCGQNINLTCTLSVVSPLVPRWHYVKVKVTRDIKMNATITVMIQGCSLLTDNGSSQTEMSKSTSFNSTMETVTMETTRLPELTTAVSTETSSTVSDTFPITTPPGDQGLCGPINALYRIEDMNTVNYALYSLGPQSANERLIFNSYEVVLVQFDVLPIKDSGGTLLYKALISEVAFNPNHTQNITVKMCISPSRIPTNKTQYYCPPEVAMEVILDTGSEDNLMATRHLPYPEPGPYFIGVQSFCYIMDNNSVGEPVKMYEPCVENFTQIIIQITNGPCVNATCAGHGECHTYRKGAYIYSSCRCYAKYKGYTCEDDSDAESENIQLLYTCLLSLSNLAFIPSIAIAIYRHYYVEALVYFANMFFSGFYHACDMHPWSIYTLCIMPYHVLSYCDFLLSIISFWVTLLAMAELPPVVVNVLHMFGVVSLAMGVEWAQHSLISYIVPITAGLILVITMWILRSVSIHRCYPGKRASLHMLPGFILAIIGLAIFAFLQDDNNYPYTHSTWHVTIALSIVFLLPRRQMDSCLGKDSDRSSDEFEFDDRNSIYQISNDRIHIITNEGLHFT